MMSNTVLPLMIESAKSIVLLECGCPGGIEHGIEIRRPAIRAHEEHGGALAVLHSRRVALYRRVRGAAGPAHEQAVGVEELPACGHGLPLRNEDHVVNDGLRQEW